MPDEEDHIATAIALLNDHGYLVSPKPIEWQEHSAIVTIKVQSRMFREADWRRLLMTLIGDLNAKRITNLTEIEVLNASNYQVKQFSKIRTKDE